MDINQVFDGIGKTMLAEFDHISSQLPQAVAKGTDREDALAKFLVSFLPQRHAVSRGFVMDHQGAVSSECDIVIYDPRNCPPLYVAERNRVFPCEAVAAVVEVKSHLSSTNLRDAMAKLQRIKALKRENGPVAGVVFAYRSEWLTEPVASLADHIQANHARFDPSEFLDLACVLDSGFVQLGEHEAQRSLTAFIALEKPVLFMFFVALLDVLQATHTSTPNYARYSKGIEIGLVRVTPAQPDAAA